MRISDWSSDLCSSDLVAPDLHTVPRQPQHGVSRDREGHLQAMAVAHGEGGHPSTDGGGMSSAGGKRRSLLAKAIEQIGRAACRARVCQDEKITEVAA